MTTEHGSVSKRQDDTQLEAIRDLMLTSGRHGTWMTLSEIAQATEFGEASISAQLRHLRKQRYGRYRVEKRRRQSDAEAAADRAGGIGDIPLWEYRVLPPSFAAKATADEPAAN